MELLGLERLSSQRSEYTSQVQGPEIDKIQLTGHGRAGWAATIAGEAGRDEEGTSLSNQEFVVKHRVEIRGKEKLRGWAQS